jgi:hypothetical protein
METKIANSRKPLQGRNDSPVRFGSRLNNDALLRSSENMRAMKITDEDRERQDTETSRRNDMILGGIVLALLASVFGVSALALMVG